MNNNAIPMTPEVVKAVNSLCDAGELDSIIVKLGNAEEALKNSAYEDDDKWELFRFARDLELIRRQFENLEKILGYEPERE
jgi:hypothetical protein